MIRKLIELSNEELKELYNKNNFLQDAVNEYAAMDAEIMTDNFLRYFDKISGVDYSIGGYNDYFTYELYKARRYGDFSDFLEAVTICDADYSFLSDDLRAALHRVKNRADFYIDARNGYENISDSKFEKLEKWIKGVVADICGAICDEASDFYTSEPELLADDLGWFIEANYADYTTDGALIYEPQIRAYA